jgi:hypothetical protein
MPKSLLVGKRNPAVFLWKFPAWRNISRQLRSNPQISQITQKQKKLSGFAAAHSGKALLYRRALKLARGCASNAAA